MALKGKGCLYGAFRDLQNLVHCIPPSYTTALEGTEICSLLVALLKAHWHCTEQHSCMVFSCFKAKGLPCFFLKSKTEWALFSFPKESSIARNTNQFWTLTPFFFYGLHKFLWVFWFWLPFSWCCSFNSQHIFEGEAVLKMVKPNWAGLEFLPFGGSPSMPGGLNSAETHGCIYATSKF